MAHLILTSFPSYDPFLTYLPDILDMDKAFIVMAIKYKPVLAPRPLGHFTHTYINP